MTKSHDVYDDVIVIMSMARFHNVKVKQIFSEMDTDGHSRVDCKDAIIASNKLGKVFKITNFC